MSTARRWCSMRSNGQSLRKMSFKKRLSNSCDSDHCHRTLSVGSTAWFGTERSVLHVLRHDGSTTKNRLRDIGNLGLNLRSTTSWTQTSQRPRSTRLASMNERLSSYESG